MIINRQLLNALKLFQFLIFSTLLGLLLLSTYACEKESKQKKTELVSIRIEPNPMMCAKGKRLSLKAAGSYKNGNTKDISDSVTWSSSDPGIAIIEKSDGNDNYVKSLQEGSVTIIATSSQGISGTAKLDVTPSELVSITIIPENISVQMGHVQQYTARGTYSDGEKKDITSQVNWSTADTSMPVISNTPGSKGLAISPPTGTISIFAEDPVTKIKGTTSLTVTTTKLVSIEVQPKNACIPLGQDASFTAIGTYVDGSTNDITSSVVWTVSQPKVAAVKEETDLQGIISSLSVGKTSVKATDPAIIVSSSAELTVTPPELTSICITLPEPLYLGVKQPLSATGVFSDKSEKDLTNSVTFSSSDPSIALITDKDGTSKNAYVMPISQGTAKITGTDTNSGISTAVPLTIKAPELVSISIKPSDPKILMGDHQQFSAIGTFADGKTKDITNTVKWTSSKPNISNIINKGKNKGLAISKRAGSAVIRASETQSGISGKTNLYTLGPKLTEILISPATTSVSVGDTIEFNATGKYNNGKTEDMTNSVLWSASKPSMVDINYKAKGKGKIKCLTAGELVITADAPDTDISGKATITINPAKLTAITLSSPGTSVPLGNVLPIYAKGLFADGTEKNITKSLRFSLSESSKATITRSKEKEISLITISPGSVVIKATDPDTDIKSALKVTITPSKLISISISPENPTLSLSRVQRFSATGIFSDGNRKDMTEQVEWESSAPNIARISNAIRKKGHVTAISEGESTIRAVDPNTGISGETGLTTKTFWQ